LNTHFGPAQAAKQDSLSVTDNRTGKPSIPMYVPWAHLLF